MAELKWTTPEWLSSAHKWIADRLAEHDRQITGTVTQPHIRPWSTALRVPAGSGTVWFKAGTDALAHEAALTPFLEGLMPDHSPRVIASDPGRGWLLLEDLGEKLRARINFVSDLHLWFEVLDLYVGLQRRATLHFDELVGTGVIDRRIESLKRQWDSLLGDRERLLVGQPDGLASQQYERALGLWSRVEELVAESECAGLPYTVVHEDLHDANVFVNDGTLIIADWGDSSIANPLATLTVLLGSAAYRRDLEPDAPPIRAIRDHYLAAWQDYADLPMLNRAADAATTLGMLHRSLGWHDGIRSAPDEHTAEWADRVPGWLDEFLSRIDP